MRHWICLWKAGCGGGLARAALGHGGRSCVRRGGGLLSLPPADSALQVPSGGLLFWLPAAPAFSLLCCPPSPKGKDIPPTRARRALFPSGEGGDQGYFMQGASPLASPGLGGMRHWGCLWKAGCGGGAYILCRLPTPPCRYSEGAFLLGCLPTLPGTFSFFIPIFRQEDRAQTIGFSQYSIFGKSSGGSGGLFQESPSVLPSVLPVPSANAVRRERVRERPSRCMTV